MVIFKSFIILLVIFIYGITEALRLSPFKIYSVGVSGALSCMYSRSGIARILISYDYRRHVVKNYIAAKTVAYGNMFYLAGMIRGYRKPFLFVKIIHNCVPSKQSYEKVFVKEIPQRFIKKGKNPGFYFMKRIELSKLKGIVIESTGLHKIE